MYYMNSQELIRSSEPFLFSESHHYTMRRHIALALLQKQCDYWVNGSNS